MTAAWNEDKTEATLTSSVKLVVGDYTVTVTGVDLVEGQNTATTTVLAEQIATIELDDNAYSTATPYAGNVTVAYKLLNQYNEDITDNYLVTNFTATSSKGTIAASQPSAKGTITITGLTVADTDKTLVVTLVDKTFAKTASKTVNIQAQIGLDTITLSQPVIPTGKDKIERTATDVVIPYAAVDQFGSEFVLANTTAMTFVSSDTTALPTANITVKSIGGTDKLVITAFGAFNGAKDITLTAIVNATGKTSSVTFTVYGTATAKTPILVEPVSSPGTSETINVELQMLDTYGNQMTAADIVAAKAGFTVLSSNTDVFTVGTIALVNKKAVIPVTAKTLKTTANLMVTVNATGESTTLPITVVEAKYPASVTLVPSATTAGKDGLITIKATFQDQYGQPITTSNNVVRFTADNNDFVLNSTSTGLLATPVDETVTNLVDTGIVVKATDWEKTTVITAELVNAAAYDADKVVDTKTLTLSSTTEAAEYTYSITAIPTLYGKAGHDKNSAYAQDIELVAKDAGGNVVSLPAGYVTNVTSTNANIGVDTATMKVFAIDEATGTIAVWKGATKLAETTVTAIEDLPIAASIEIEEEAITIDGKNAADALTAIKANMEIKDQYGVVVVPVGGTNGMWTSDDTDKVAFAANAITTYGNTDDVTIGFITTNGLVATMQVEITNAILADSLASDAFTLVAASNRITIEIPTGTFAPDANIKAANFTFDGANADAKAALAAGTFTRVDDTHVTVDFVASADNASADTTVIVKAAAQAVQAGKPAVTVTVEPQAYEPKDACLLNTPT